MAKETRFGDQPVRAEMARQRWTPGLVAKELDLDRRHIVNAVRGACRPMPGLIKGLSKLLGKPARALWTEDILEYPYDPRRIAYADVRRARLKALGGQR